MKRPATVQGIEIRTPKKNTEKRDLLRILIFSLFSRAKEKQSYKEEKESLIAIYRNVQKTLKLKETSKQKVKYSLFSGL